MADLKTPPENKMAPEGVRAPKGAGGADLEGLHTSEDKASAIEPQAIPYPTPLWHKGSVETSRVAAMACRFNAKNQADLCLQVIREQGNATPEEVHKALSEDGHSVLLTTIRARICGLYKKGVLRPSDRRGLGESQRCKVIAWELSPAFDSQPLSIGGEAQS